MARYLKKKGDDSGRKFIHTPLLAAREDMEEMIEEEVPEDKELKDETPKDETPKDETPKDEASKDTLVVSTGPASFTPKKPILGKKDK